MASWQHQLISRIIRAGNLSEVLEWGIIAEDFTQGETLGLFHQLCAYNSMPDTAGSVWGPMSMASKFPNFVLCDDPGMTTEALCNEVRRNRIQTETRKLVLNVNNILEVDPVQAVTILANSSIQLQNELTPKKVDVHISDGALRVWQQYCAVERGEVVSVAPWPWQPLQKATLGIRGTDYIIIYGRPKSYKTWVLCYLITFFITQELGLRILIYTKEMDAEEVTERILCIIAEVDYERFTQGTLTPEERVSVDSAAAWLFSAKKHLMIIILSGQDAGPGQDTVQWFQSKIEHYKPHIACIDGMYLMSDASGTRKPNEKVANISRAVRQLVLRNKIPVIATTQSNRESAKNEEANTHEVSFSDSLGQDATMLIRVINEWKKKEDKLALVMGGASRRYKLEGFRIWGQPAYNFRYFGELSSQDAAEAVKEDDKDPAKKPKGKKGYRPVQPPDPRKEIPAGTHTPGAS